MGIRRRGESAVGRWRWIDWAVLIVEWRKREVGGASACFRRVGSGFALEARDRQKYAARRWFHDARLIRAMQKATLRRSASPSYDAVGPSAFDPSGKGFQLVSHASCDLAT